MMDAVTALVDRIEKERAVLAELRHLKVALADALLTGKIRVSGRRRGLESAARQCPGAS